MKDATETTLQSKVFDFAVIQLVLQHRDYFQPAWSLDSWVKFLIWLALNCGLSGDRASLELFAKALGSPLTSRMRRLFFEREIDDLQLKVMADPADANVLVMPLSGGGEVSLEQAQQVIKELGLLENVERDQKLWQILDSIIAIPRKLPDTSV